MLAIFIGFDKGCLINVKILLFKVISFDKWVDLVFA